MIRMTWKGFEDKYKFEEHDGSNMVETNSSRVKEIEDKYGDEAWRYIWTWCSQGSDEYFVAGYAFVNRMNYMIATVPHDLEEGESVEIVEIFAEQNIDGYAWFSLAIDKEVMETSEYTDWRPDEEDEKGEFDFDKLVKTELMGNRYLGRDIIADTFMKTMREVA